VPSGRLPGIDVRASSNPVLVSARRWLARVNARRPWSHNEHFHGWILRNLSARRRAVVDVGCGTRQGRRARPAGPGQVPASHASFTTPLTGVSGAADGTMVR
jgi:hypothetical protein